MKRILCFFLVVAAACTPEEIDVKQRDITDIFLASGSVRDLGVSAGSLDLSRKRITGNDTASPKIMIPFKDNELMYIVSRGSLENGEMTFRNAVIIQYVTELTTDELVAAIESQTYTGGVDILVNDGLHLNFQMENSKLIDTRSERIGLKAAPGGDETPKGPECPDSPSGFAREAMECAARRIENMHWLDRAACYVIIVECVIEEMAFCVLDGCPYM